MRKEIVKRFLNDLKTYQLSNSDIEKVERKLKRMKVVPDCMISIQNIRLCRDNIEHNTYCTEIYIDRERIYECDVVLYRYKTNTKIKVTKIRLEESKVSKHFLKVF